MLRQLRSEKFKKFLLIGLLFIVVPSFVVFYGWQQGGGAESSEAVSKPAKIKFGPMDKVEITSNDVSNARRMLRMKYDAYERTTGKRVDPAAIERIMEPADLINAAIDQKIWEHLAHEKGIYVSLDDAMADITAQYPDPRQRGFLVQNLNQNGLTFDQFVFLQRMNMQDELARQTIAASARASFFEAWLEYARRNEKLAAEFVRFNVSDFAPKVEVTDEKLAAYFKENAEQFTIPDQVKFRYLLANKGDLRTSVTVTDDDITSYYNGNQDAYRIPPAVEARQILVNIAAPRPDESEDAHTSAVQVAQAQAREIYNRVAKGEDFATVATSATQETFFPPRQTAPQDPATSLTAEDADTTAGGYLGFISENDAKTFYGDDWTSVVFNAKEGDIIPPLNIGRAFAIVKVMGRKESVVQPLDTVRNMVIERVKDEKAQPLFEALQDEMEKKSTAIADLSKLAEATSQTVKTTGKVDKGANMILGIGLIGNFQDALSILERGGRSDVLADANRLLIVELQEDFPSHVPPMNEVRADVEKSYREKIGREDALKAAEAIKAKATNPETFRTAVADATLSTTVSSDFVRDGYAAALGPVVDFSNTIDGLKDNQIEMSPLGDKEQPSGYIVWFIAKRTPPSRTDYAKALDKIVPELSSRKANILMQEYLRDRRKELGDNIEINKAFRK